MKDDSIFVKGLLQRIHYEQLIVISVSIIWQVKNN